MIFRVFKFKHLQKESSEPFWTIIDDGVYEFTDFLFHTHHVCCHSVPLLHCSSNPSYFILHLYFPISPDGGWRGHGERRTENEGEQEEEREKINCDGVWLSKTHSQTWTDNYFPSGQFDWRQTFFRVYLMDLVFVSKYMKPIIVFFSTMRCWIMFSFYLFLKNKKGGERI